MGDPRDHGDRGVALVVRDVLYEGAVQLHAVHGEAAAGRPYAMDTLHVYRTEADRVAEHWGVRDEFGALVQLGVLQAPQVPLDVEVPAP